MRRRRRQCDRMRESELPAGRAGHSDAVSSRRSFLLRSGLLAATGGLAIGPAQIPAAAGVAPLDPARRRTYRALVRTVGASPGTLINPGHAREAEAALTTYYANGDEGIRRSVEACLDVCDERLTGGIFANLDKHMRLRHLLKLSLDDAVGAPAGPSPAHRIKKAIALAAAPFNPSGFDWDPAAADLWIRALHLRDD